MQEVSESKPVARVHFSTKQGTKRIAVKDDELAETLKEIEKSGGMVLRVSRVD